MKKLMVFGISILILFLINCVSAQEINFDYPEEVYYGEIFDASVELIDFSEDIYDVKIDIKNEANQRISKILNEGEWKTTYNYVTEMIDTSEDNESSFSLNITEEYNGTASIEVKIRDSSGKIKTFSDYSIEILQEIGDEEEENEEPIDVNQDEIYLELDWDDEEIINGEEFDVEITAFNLKDKMYDVRLYIYDDDGEIISEILDEEQDKWKSGQYYVVETLEGPDEDSWILTSRIDEDYVDFSGSAHMKARIRQFETSPIIAEVEYSIDILEKEVDEQIDGDEEDYEETEEEPEEEPEKIEGNEKVIKLGNGKKIEQETKETKEEVKILYESKSEKVKKYSIYLLNLVLVGIIIFLLINFKNKEKQ